MILATDGITVRYGRRVAVDCVPLTAGPGEVLAILGANGSGKSSLLRSLAGLQAFQGRLTWDGLAVPGCGIGYMSQDNGGRAALTVFEIVLLGRLRSLTFRVGAADLTAARDILAELGIEELAGQPIGALSGGQRQLVFMAQVLAADPTLLLLDEPTSALDIAHQLHVLALVRDATTRRGLTTIAVLHDLNAAARFADRLMVLRAGRLVAAGRPGDVLVPAVLREAYQVDVAVIPGSDRYPVVVPLRSASMPSCPVVRSLPPADPARPGDDLACGRVGGAGWRG